MSIAELDQYKLRALAKAHGNRVTIGADPNTPWRCVAGAIYNLQAAGIHADAVGGTAIQPE